MIRVATPNDVPWCAARDYAPTPALQAAVDAGRVFVAISARGALTGVLRGTWFHDVVPMLALIYVDQEHRKAGTGRRLLDTWCEGLRGQGQTVVYSSGTQGEDLSAAWHKACGFETCGSIDDFNGAGIDEIMYRRRLA